MRQDYGINMSYEKAWRARENTCERVRWSPEESYNLLRSYGEALKVTNPAYTEGVYPVGNQSDWKTSEDDVYMIVLPLKVVKRVSQPKKKRIPSIGEAPKLHKCGRCKEIGWAKKLIKRLAKRRGMAVMLEFNLIGPLR
ncbi:MuDRA-like transposase [Cucumis melo var. makuwa]|uniref:MuDRA-like transposase n=1 Tax=Cucumis melo var. makuwa TaxID=1194695 RepID=A0A5A7U7Y1_CUCMM|nr:MuDRA-like transposase [Cucumis melo var. makuwa]